MKKRNQKLLSLFLSAMMVVGVVPSTVYAAPEQATEIAVEQEAGTEATNEDTVINEADASADKAQENTDEARQMIQHRKTKLQRKSKQTPRLKIQENRFIQSVKSM